MSDSANNSSKGTKVLSNSEAFLQSVLKSKDTDSTFIKPIEKQQDASKENLADTSNQQQEEEKAEIKEEPLSPQDLEEYYPKDIKIYDPQKIEVDTLMGNAITCYKNKQFFKSIPIFKKLLEISPNNLKAMSILCECLLEQNRIKDEISVAQKGLTIAQQQQHTYYVKKFQTFAAKGYTKSGDSKQSEKAHKLALVQDFTNIKLYTELIKSYLKSNKIDEAFKACNKARLYAITDQEKAEFEPLQSQVKEEYYKLHPEQKFIADGYEYYMKGKAELALKEYEKAHKIAPENLAVLGKMFYAYIDLNRLNEAIEVGEKVVSSDRESLEKYYELNDINPELYGIYSRLAEIFKHSWHFIKAKQYQTMSDYHQLIQRGTYESIFKKHKAIELFMAAYNLKPEKHEALENLIIHLIWVHRYDEALKYLQKGLSLAKAENNAAKFAVYYGLEAFYYEERQQYKKEIESYEKKASYTRDKQEKLTIYGLIARIYKEKGNIEQYKVYLEKCQELVNQGAEDTLDLKKAFMELEVTADNNSEFNKAKECFRKASRLYSQKKYDEALAEYKKSFWLMPYDLQIMEAYSKCLSEQEYYQEASNIAYEALELSVDTENNKYAESLFYTVAKFHFYQKKDYDEARKFFELAIRHNPSGFEYYYKTAICYKELDRTEKAIKNFEKAYELKPSEKHILDEVYNLSHQFAKESQKEFYGWLIDQKYNFPHQL